MEYDPDQAPDDQAQHRREIDATDPRKAVLDAFDRYMEEREPGAGRDHVWEDVPYPTDHGNVPHNYRVARQCLDEIDPVAVDPDVLVAAHDGPEGYQAVGTFLSDLYRRHDSEEFDFSPDTDQEVRYLGWGLPDDTTLINDATVRTMGKAGTGTIINRGEVTEELGYAGMDLTVLNQGTVAVDLQTSGLFINHGTVGQTAQTLSDSGPDVVVNLGEYEDGIEFPDEPLEEGATYPAIGFLQRRDLLVDRTDTSALVYDGETVFPEPATQETLREYLDNLDRDLRGTGTVVDDPVPGLEGLRQQLVADIGRILDGGDHDGTV